MKNIIFFALLLLIMTNVSIAQQTNNIIPPSPDAASLGVYGNIPVSAYTGVPDINIPLYNIKYRDIQIPVALSYHSAGVTLEAEAGWVGLNWSLIAGGVITRTVRGGDDMQFATDGISDAGSVGINYQGYPYDPGPSSGNYLQSICNKSVDAEPDMFYFNFLGKSGSFVLERGQNASLSYTIGTPLRAEKIEIKYDKVNHRWQIRTADGYTYYFGTIEATETLHGKGDYGKGPEYVVFDATTHGFLSFEDIVVSAWYLDKVITPTGEEITYVYDTIDEMVNGSPTGRKYSRFGSARMSINDVQKTTIDPIAESSCYAPPLQTSAVKIFTNHIYLKEIQHPMGKVTFNKSLRDDMLPATYISNAYPYLSNTPFYMANWSQFGPQKLDNIIIQDINGNTVKKFEFEYDYFNAQVTGFDRYNFKRLKLARVRECGTQECKPWSQLVYNETLPLPSKYSNAQDFWGYYNGAFDNISRIPFGTFYYGGTSKYYYMGDSNRQPNALYMTAGTLNKIIYPTGGSTEFEFEPHDYYNFGNDAFAVTDFENNSFVGITELITTEDGPSFKTVTFTVTEPVQDIVIDGQMIYYPSATTSSPCNVVSPGTIYAGNETWCSLTNTANSSSITTRFMSDFINYFVSNYNNNCINPYRPEAIEPIYRSRSTFTLNAGTYELKVYARQQFNIHVVVSKNTLHPRTIPLNAQGVYAKIAGGLRIKKITTRDNVTAIPQVKRYDYTVTDPNNDKKSTGRLMLYPNYHIPFYCTYDISSQTLVAMMGRSWSNTPLATSASGSIVGYDKITEWQGESTATNGRTEYYYRNQEEEPLSFQVFIEGLPTRKRTSNGLVTDIKYFDAAGNILRSENFDYTRQLQKDIEGMASQQLIIKYLYTNYNVCAQQTMIGQEYYLAADRWVPNTKTEIQYGQQSSGSLQTVTTYTYDTQTHLQLKSEQSALSNGDVIKTDYKYPPDASWIPTAMWQDKFLYGIPVETKVYKNNNLISTHKSNYTSQANTFLLTNEESAIGAAQLESVSSYYYSVKGNVQEIKSRKEGPKIYLWGYNHTYPLAEINNATIAQVLAAMGTINEATLNSFASQNTPSADYLNRITNLRANLPYALVSTYTYEPYIGIKTATSPNGIITYYEYDNYGRLIILKDQNQNIIKKLEYKYQSQ